MLGLYENFPANIHLTQTFTSALSQRKLQEKLVQVFSKLNRETFRFEEVGTPTVPNATVNFEFGIAADGDFHYLNENQTQTLLAAIKNQPLPIMDWFCALRYYKTANGKKSPLKFDYYMLRVGFGDRDLVEVLVSHERGPRYLSPEDVAAAITGKINGAAKRKILTPT